MSSFTKSIDALGSGVDTINSGFLMLEDTPVLYFNFNDDFIKVLDTKKIPYSFRRFAEEYNEDSIKDIIKLLVRFRLWLSGRIFNAGIANYKQISMCFNVIQTNDVNYRSDVALCMRAVSLEDAYWVKGEYEDISWKEVSPNNVPFSNLYELISSNDSVIKQTSEVHNPNITLSGTFRKMWMFMDNKPHLVKCDSMKDKINVQVETMASELLKCLVSGNKCVMYSRKVIDGNICSICESYYKEGYSVVKATDLMFYLGGHDEYISAINKECINSIANMIVIDYIIGNTDRHMDNYAWYMDNSTGEIKWDMMVPLYDFNLAFVAYELGTNIDNTLCQVFNTKETMKEVFAKYYEYNTLEFDKNSLYFFRQYWNKLYPNAVHSTFSKLHNLNIKMV